MPVPDLFGILDAVKKLTSPAGMETVHQDGFSSARNGLTYGDSTKLTPDDWNRIVGNLRGLLVGSGVDLNTLDPASPMLLRDVLINYIIAELADVLPDYIDDNAATIAADIMADQTFVGILGSALGARTFKFATANADADPGPGNFRLNNAAPASATAAFIDNTDAYGATVTGALDGWDDSTNTIRGTLTIRPSDGGTARYVFNVTGSVVDGTGYRKLTLAYVSGSGAITAGASCWLVFNRTGDKGANGIGDVNGPAASVSGNLTSFSGTTGKLLQDSGVPAANVATGPVAAVSGNLPSFNGTGGKTLQDSGVAASNVAKLNTANAFTAGQGINTTVGQAMGVTGGPAAGTSGLIINSVAGAGNASFMSFNRNGAYAAHFGIDTDNMWKVGGWSMGANAYKLLHEGLAAGNFAGAFTWLGAQSFSSAITLTSGQITFPATDVPSSNANTLNDYEEGTFTPVLIGLTTAGTGTYNAQTGKYTKIGNLVSYAVNVSWTAHTGTGTMSIAGMPFTAAVTGVVGAVYFNNMTFTGSPQAYIPVNTSAISVETAASGGASQPLGMDTAANVRCSGQLFTV